MNVSHLLMGSRRLEKGGEQQRRKPSSMEENRPEGHPGRNLHFFEGNSSPALPLRGSPSKVHSGAGEVSRAQGDGREGA